MLFQRILRPIKKLAVMLNMVPKTMRGKKWLKRLVFGELVKLPNEINMDAYEFSGLIQIDSDTPDRSHKVIYCEARKIG